MASSVENKDMSQGTFTGTLQFDEETKSCYILMENGAKHPTSPMFDFFNGYISFSDLEDRIADFYTEEQIEQFNELFSRHLSGDITADELYNTAREKFGF
jgi:hypothetical protein